MALGTGNVRGVHVRCNVHEHELIAWYARQVGQKAGPLLRTMPFDVAVKYAERLRRRYAKTRTKSEQVRLLAEETGHLAKWLRLVEAA